MIKAEQEQSVPYSSPSFRPPFWACLFSAILLRDWTDREALFVRENLLGNVDTGRSPNLDAAAATLGALKCK